MVACCRSVNGGKGSSRLPQPRVRRLFGLPRLTGNRLANGRSGARPHRQLEAPHLEKSLLSLLSSRWQQTPAWSLGRLCLFLLFLFFAPFALVGLHKRGAGLLCAVGAARQREEQQTSGARSGFGALIGRLGKWGGSAQEPGTGTFSDMEAQSHISACTRHEAGSEPRSLFGQIR